jgi:hypothetical protein
MTFEWGIALLCLGLPAAAAFGVMYTIDFPRAREMRLNVKLQAAFKKANTEAAGLRKALEGADMRMRDIRAATAGMDQNLRYKIQRMSARDQAALDALIGQGTFSGLLAILRNGVLVDRRLAELKRTWSRGMSERECARVLCENLWVLEPDLTSEGHIFAGKALGSVAEAYFGAPAPSDDLAIAAARKKPTAVGMFRRRSTIGKPNGPGDKTLVIIEARRPGEAVSQAVISAGVGYAHAMRKLVPELADWPVECMIVGGNFSADAQFTASHAPPGTPVHLVTWDALYERARARRPETVSLVPVRLDADNPPLFDLGARERAAGSFLDLQDEPDANARSAATGDAG